MSDELKCYKFEDGETHYIVARDEASARQMYVEDCNNDPGANDEVKVKELPRETMAKIKIGMTLADLFDDCDAPCVLAGTVD